MRVIDASKTGILVLGYQGESQRVMVRLPLVDERNGRNVAEEFPGGQFSLSVTFPNRPGEFIVSPSDYQVSGNWIEWEVKAAYTQFFGEGNLQINYSGFDSTGMVKSRVWRITNKKSISTGSGTVPDWSDWKTELLTAAAAVQSAVDSYDEMTAEAEDGDQTSAHIDRTGDHPVLQITIKNNGGGGGAVESVNSKTGVVVLDANDVGALPADTPIPPAVTVDSELSGTSTNPVQNRVVKNALDQKANSTTISQLSETIVQLAGTVSGKISEPQSEGTNGQFLMTDGNGGRTWGTPSGGGGADIDDSSTAVNKVWSAHKVNETFEGLNSKLFDITSSKSTETGKAVNATTGEIIDASAVTLVSLPVIPGTKLSGYTRGGGYERGVGFYDKDGKFLTGYYNSSSEYDWNYSNIPVPNDAVVVRFSCTTTYLSGFSCKIESGLTTGITDTLIAIKNSGTQISGVLDYTWNDGCFIDAVGDVSENANVSVASADLTLCPGGKIEGHTRLGDERYIGFYDATDNLISVHARIGSDYNYDFSIDVPENACTVRISCGSSYKSGFALRYIGDLKKSIEMFSRSPVWDYTVPAWVKNVGADGEFKNTSTTKLNDIIHACDMLKAVFDKRITKYQYGTSQTPEGDCAVTDSNTYPLLCYVITGEDYFPGNDIMFATGIHGDGVTGDGIQSVVSAYYFIKDMLFNPNKNNYLKYLNKHCRIYYIPVLNPWGYQNNERGNGRKVDLNRNFVYGWESGSGYDCTYGTAALSEAESSAVQTYIQSISTLKYVIELHTRGETVLPDDQRWWVQNFNNYTGLQNTLSALCTRMTQIYGGTGGSSDVSMAEPQATFTRNINGYLGGHAIMSELFKSFDMNIDTLDTDEVMIQCVHWVALLHQTMAKLVFKLN